MNDLDIHTDVQPRSLTCISLCYIHRTHFTVTAIPMEKLEVVRNTWLPKSRQV